MLTLRIEDVADTGQGLAKVDGLVYFVSSGLPGDLVSARVLEKKKNYCVCETLKLLEPSELRREEFRTLLVSPYGLDLLPLKDGAELELKEKKVRMELQKALGPSLEEAKFNPIIGMEERTRYRNKAVFPFRFVDGRNVCGAFERLSHNIVEEVDNPSMPFSFARINEALITWLNEASLRCYDEDKHKGTLRYATLRVNDKGEHLILLTLKEDRLPDVKDLALCLETEGIAVKGILKTVKEERGNTPYGRGIELIYGSDRLEDRVGGVKFSLSVKSFFQVSREGCERLYNEVYRLADLDKVASLWDVYCGVGSIGLYLLAKYRSASAPVNSQETLVGSASTSPQPTPAPDAISPRGAGPVTPPLGATCPASTFDGLASSATGPTPLPNNPAFDATCPKSVTALDSGNTSAAANSQETLAGSVTNAENSIAGQDPASDKAALDAATRMSVAAPPFTPDNPTFASAYPASRATKLNSPIELWGLEAVEDAVRDAALNASLNGITNAEFEYGLAEKALAQRFRTHRAPDLLIVDPPRKGLDRSAVDAIIKAAPERIIYVSCKVSTLARDLKLFTEAGYQLVEVTPVNLFPMTMHVETSCLLIRE